MIPCTIATAPRIILALAALPFAMACSEPPAPRSPPMAYVEPPRAPEAAPPRPVEPEATLVVLDPTIMTTCGIPQPKSFFAFDSAVLRQSDETGLTGVATCFREGPLKGKGMEIAGRTDPRGTAAYNQTLGELRAGAVSDYLITSGVREDTIAKVSSGEDLAIGTDEMGWARDRRVDIKLQ